MASITQPTHTSAPRCSHLSLRPHRRAVWLLPLIISLTVVGIGSGLLQRNAAEATTPPPLATAYDDVFFSGTSGHTQPRPRAGTTVLQEQEELARDARDVWLSIAAPVRLSVSDRQTALVGPQPLGGPSSGPIVAVPATDQQNWLIGPQPLGGTTSRSSVLPSVRDLHRDLTGSLPVTK